MTAAATKTDLPGLEVVELPEHDSGLALLEHFGVAESVPVQSPPELTLVPIERDRFEDRLRRAFNTPERKERRGLA